MLHFFYCVYLLLSTNQLNWARVDSRSRMGSPFEWHLLKPDSHSATHL